MFPLSRRYRSRSPHSGDRHREEVNHRYRYSREYEREDRRNTDYIEPSYRSSPRNEKPHYKARDSGNDIQPKSQLSEKPPDSETPKFLSKEEREKLALEERQKQVEQIRQKQEKDVSKKNSDKMENEYGRDRRDYYDRDRFDRYDRDRGCDVGDKRSTDKSDLNDEKDRKNYKCIIRFMLQCEFIVITIN
ncbi:hypothetical protein F8M41_010383 [Gigaspora margarita]|uniref:Uncharacterized protein n=1 Tax=Gigaspora margarita TaxID=4874 RepID=A0A8H4A1A8_GIGMA|nr:hypothetical protein F8M41_010383 [Gigaspora margarita]